jgi:hypothetical protein
MIGFFTKPLQKDTKRKKTDFVQLGKQIERLHINISLRFSVYLIPKSGLYLCTVVCMLIIPIEIK